MRSTKIVTSFIKNGNKILILKRSDKVRTMRGLWSGVSGIIEKGETPINRAKIEIFEEIGIRKDKISLTKSVEKIKIFSPQYEDHEWEVFSFLFETKETKIKLNWENSEFRWINVNELENYKTVPNLDKILFNLL